MTTQQSGLDRREDLLLAGDNARVLDVIHRVRQRQRRSLELGDRVARSLSGAPSNASYGAPLLPICVTRARGAIIEDVDGNRYIDCQMGSSAAILGHRPDPVVAAVAAAVEAGIGPGELSAPLIELAELVCQLIPTAERVLLVHSGSEAIEAAVRLARAKTGRSMVAKFASCYHGWSEIGLYNSSSRPGDGAGEIAPRPVTSGLPANAELLILPYNSPRALDLIDEHAGQLAAVLIDPLPPFIEQWPDAARRFAAEVRRVTAARGVPLILDEVVSGFRLAPGGAQEAFSISAELAACGKITSGLGLPLAMVAGRADFLDSATTGGLLADGRLGKARIATTCAAGHLPAVAALAQLRLLRDRFDDIASHLDRNHQLLGDRLARFARESGIAVSLYGHPRMRSMVMLGDFGTAESFHEATAKDGAARLRAMHCLTLYLRLEGVYAHSIPRMNLSFAHREDDVERITAAVERSLLAMRDDGALPASCQRDQP